MENLFPQNLTLKESNEFQAKLVQQLVLEDDFSGEIKAVGAATMHTRGDFITVSAAVFNTSSELKKFELADKNIIRERAQFPAVPGFESFRDGAVLAKVLHGFAKPDLFFIEGHGINHPHKLGLASHVGLALDVPTIAVSRDFVAGSIRDVDGKSAIASNSEIVGAVMKAGALKLYVAPGHRISWQSALELAKKCSKSNYPEPLRIVQANLVAEINNVLKSDGVIFD
jgi:deoxyribonuclease V